MPTEDSISAYRATAKNEADRLNKTLDRHVLDIMVAPRLTNRINELRGASATRIERVELQCVKHGYRLYAYASGTHILFSKRYNYFTMFSAHAFASMAAYASIRIHGLDAFADRVVTRMVSDLAKHEAFLVLRGHTQPPEAWTSLDERSALCGTVHQSTQTSTRSSSL